MHIQDITQRHVPTLAKLLQFRPTEDRKDLSERIANGSKTLPSSLRPSRLEKLLLVPRGRLCELHKCLHYDVVSAVLNHLKLEVGVRSNSLISHHELLAPEQYTRLQRLRALHALWLNPTEYRKIFMASSRVLKWKYQVDQCAACIISHITSDLQILLDLRWASRSRATRAFVAKYGNPRLQQWIYVWIGSLAIDVEAVTGYAIDIDAVVRQNEEEAILLKKTRAEIATLKQQKHNYQETGLGRGGFLTEVACDYSYPIHAAPYKVKPQEPPAAHDTSGIQAEDYVGDTNETHIEGMDPLEALTSTPCLPSTVFSPPKLPAESIMTVDTVCADPSTKNQHPYGHKSHRRATLESVYSVDIFLEDRLPAVAEENEDIAHAQEYVPPRSMWPKDPPTAQKPALPSSSLLPHLAGSVASRDSWENSSTSVSSKGAWETEQCLATNSSTSSVYSAPEEPPIRKAYASPSQSWASLSNLATQTYYSQPGQTRKSQARKRPPSDVSRKGNPADTYTNILHNSPFSESSATLRPQIVAEQVRETSTKESISPRKTASGSFLSLYDKVSRPTDSSGPATTPTNHHSSSATPSRRGDCGGDVHQRAAESTNRQSSSVPQHSDSTEHFLRIYDEVVSAYMPSEQFLSTTLPTLSSKKYCPTQHDANIDHSVKDFTRGTTPHEQHLDPYEIREALGRHTSTSTSRTYRSHTSSTLTPTLTSTSTLSSDSSSDTVIPQRGHHPIPRGTKDLQGQRNSPEGSDSSDETSWSGTYESQIQSRGDLGWFYENGGKGRR